MSEVNFSHTVGTAFTTAILFCGVAINDQTLALLQVIPCQPPAQIGTTYGLTYDRYTLNNESYSDERKNIEIIHKFASNLLANIEDMPLEFSEAVDDNFWELI